MMKEADFKEKALESLKGKWGVAVGTGVFVGSGVSVDSGAIIVSDDSVLSDVTVDFEVVVPSDFIGSSLASIFGAIPMATKNRMPITHLFIHFFNGNLLQIKSCNREIGIVSILISKSKIAATDGK